MNNGHLGVYLRSSLCKGVSHVISRRRVNFSAVMQREASAAPVDDLPLVICEDQTVRTLLCSYIDSHPVFCSEFDNLNGVGSLLRDLPGHPLISTVA